MRLFTHILHLVTRHIFVAVGSSLLFALFALAIYRLYFHPLAKFPGRKLAALTVWYEHYHDAIRRGQYTFEIKDMHERYGPIVRISPNELHVNDPAFIDKIYAGGGKRRDKYEHYTAQFGIPQSCFATVSHDIHRLRRNALSSFFSKAAITKMEPLMVKYIQKMCEKIGIHAGSGAPVTISSAFSCMATDIVAEYAFAEHTNFLSTESPGFERNLHDAILAGSEIGLYLKPFPWLHTVLQALPASLLSWLNPEMAGYLTFQNNMRDQIREIKQSMAQERGKDGVTIFHSLLNGTLPESEKTVSRLWQEGQVLMGAGTETAAWGLSVTLFNLLSNPEVLSRLRQELEVAIPDQSSLPSLVTLEQLPYLIIIFEGLRFSYGISTRSQRIAYEPLMFKSYIASTSNSPRWFGDDNCDVVEYEIPPGTPVGMTSVLINRHPEIFPDPDKFIPERWIDGNGRIRHDLKGYLFTFSKGTRQCLGINLAYGELYMAIAAVIRIFGDRMTLFETTSEDVDIQHDAFMPIPKPGTKGIRVLVDSA